MEQNGLGLVRFARERIVYLLALGATLGVLPFAVIAFLNGKLLLGSLTAALVLCLWLNAWALRLSRKPFVPVPVLFLLLLATLAASMAAHGLTGALWAYPAVLLFHFLTERRLANLCNAVVVVMAVLFVAPELEPVLTWRVAATLISTILVANIFSYAADRQQQQTMRQSQRADLLVRATKAGLLEWNVVTSAVTYSARYKEMLGHAPDCDTAGWSDWFEMIHADDREMVRQVLQQQLREPKAADSVHQHAPLDLRLLHADGSAVWVHAEAVSVSDGSGRAQRYVCSFTDIAAQRANEQVLRDQALLIETIIASVPNAIFVKDPKGRFTLVNRGWSEMSGMPVERAIGSTVHDIYPPELAQRFAAEDEQLIAAGAGAPPVESIHHGPGPDQWHVVRKAVLTRADGSVRGLVASSTDISEFKRVETELSHQVRFTQALLEALPVAVSLRDSGGHFLTVNRAWEQDFDIARADVLGKRFAQLPGWSGTAELDRMTAAAEAADRATLERGLDGAPETVERVRQGRSYLTTRRAFGGNDGQVSGVLVVSVDATEQRQMAAALAFEQQRLDLVVQAAGVGIVDWEGRTSSFYYSPRFREMRGYAADADTSNWPDYFKGQIHHEDRARVLGRFGEFILGRGEHRQAIHYTPEEYRVSRADGSHFWVEAAGICVRDEMGVATRFIAAVTDITERRTREFVQQESLRQRHALVESLATEQRRLDLVVRAAKAGIVDWDGATRTAFYSPRLRELRGYAEDTDTSGWPDYFDQIHADDKVRVLAAFQAHIKGKGEKGAQEFHAPIEYRLSRMDGSYVWVQGMGVSVRDVKGYANRFIASITDISKQRENEEKLRDSVRLREEVERMSRHDLKTPINSVIAVSRMLRNGGRFNAEDRKLLETVERASYRVLNMVNLSLDLFRMEQGSYEFRPRAIDLEEIAAKVATDLQGQAASKHVTIDVVCAAPVVARIEELLCYSMFANLTKNAVEAAPEQSRVTITLAQNETWALARIHNRGAVPEGVRQRFFQKYATAGKSAGLGLGAYSAHLMARVQGGDLTLDSTPENGTTLIARFAAATSEEAAMSVRTRPLETSHGTLRNLTQLPRLRVLAADDDEFNRLVLQRDLPAPLQVTMVVNGRAAVDAALRDWPDVVLLDLEMPVMTGYEAARRLREIEHTEGRKRCLIIAISSNDEDVIVQRALAEGCDHYLVKPAAREQLWYLLAGQVPAEVAAGQQQTAQVVQPAGQPAVPQAIQRPTEMRGGPDASTAADPVLVDADLESSLPKFLDTRRQSLAEMSTAIGTGDREQFKRLAHRLAGSFGLYGFRWASVQCKALERDAEAGDAASLTARTAALAQHLEQAVVRFVPPEQA